MLAWSAIVAEGVVGLLLLVGVAAWIATIIGLSLCGGFALASLKAMRSNQKIPCNCFGMGSSVLGASTLVRAAAIALGLLVYYVTTAILPGVWWPQRPTDVLIGAGGASLLILLGAWLVAAERILTLIRERRNVEFSTRGLTINREENLL
jgi:hypothetical protein